MGDENETDGEKFERIFGKFIENSGKLSFACQEKHQCSTAKTKEAI